VCPHQTAHALGVARAPEVACARLGTLYWRSEPSGERRGRRGSGKGDWADGEGGDVARGWLVLADWRRPWRLAGDLVRWLFSRFLALLAGYGYHPGRSVLWYLATIAGFAFAYFHLGPAEGIPFSQLGALVFSVTSFHGRGFFPGGSSGHSLTLDDPVTVLAAIEAVIGLLIEISFIATFTQRFFNSR